MYVFFYFMYISNNISYSKKRWTWDCYLQRLWLVDMKWTCQIRVTHDTARGSRIDTISFVNNGNIPSVDLTISVASRNNHLSPLFIISSKLSF